MTSAGEGLLLSTTFWCALAIYAIAERALTGWLPSRLHYAWSVAASAAFLWYFTALHAGQLALLYAALILVFLGATRLLRRRNEAGALGRLLALVGIVVLVWALGKIGTSLALERLSWLFFLGTSFLLVKLWTFFKDVYDGRVDDPRLLTFLCYCTFFPCFISGPMHTYGEFRAAFDRRLPLDGVAFVDQVFRAVQGLVKVLIVAVLLRPYSLDGLEHGGLSEVSAAELGLRSLVYSWVIYLDFAGYSDIAIACGGLIGIRVPENFRMPYLAQNLREFWQRWHITFTRFLTQYLFVPFVRSLQAAGTAFGVTVAAYLATFLFCGFWHGTTANFLIWGLYHGAGLALYDLYRTRRLARARALGRPPGAPSLVARCLGAGATYVFVSLGWMFFALPMSFWVH